MDITLIEEIFKDYKKWNKSIEHQLINLGFVVKHDGKHPKIYINNKSVTISSTPSDRYAGRQIVRQIRRILSEEYYKNNYNS